MRSKYRVISFGFLSLLGISLMFLISGYSKLAALIPLAVAWVSLILTIQSFDRYYYGKNIWARTRKEKIDVVIATFALCIILDLFGMLFTRLWYYPPGTFTMYLAIAPIFYFLYGKLLYLLYESIEEFFKPYFVDTGYSKYYSAVMDLQLGLGVLLSIISIYITAGYYRQINDTILKIGEPGGFQVEWWFIAIVLLAAYFLIEYLCYHSDKPTLTMNLLSGNFYPIISIVIASILAILLTEIVNAPFQIWSFSEQAWPYSHISLFKIPVIAYVLWPLQFLPLIGLFRYLYSDEREVW